MSANLRVERSLLAVFLMACPASAVAQDAGPTHLTACVSATGSVRVIDPAAACTPDERRFALATGEPADSDGDLLRNLVLLAATAVTSGLLVPYVLGRIDYRRSEQQRERQARIARESKVIDAQVRLLEGLSRVLWRWRYLVMKVTYYGSVSADPRYEDACREYDTVIWDVLNRFRLEVSRSQRLSSRAVYGRLLDFYQLMVDTDNRIRQIQRANEGPAKLAMALSDLNAEVFDTVTARIETMLNAAAHEMGLVARGSAENQAVG